MKHLGTKTLETKRLILRKFKQSDYLDMYNNWASEVMVARFMPWSAHENESVTKTVVNMWVDEYKNDDNYNWVIMLKDTNAM